MPRPHGTFKDVFDAVRMHGVGLWLGIQLRFVGRKHNVAIDAFELRAIVLQRARIAIKIFSWPELQAIDKNTNHRASAPWTGFFDESKMSFVQISHGRHEHIVRHALQVFAQLSDGVNEFHDGCPCLVATDRLSQRVNGVNQLVGLADDAMRARILQLIQRAETPQYAK